MPRICRSPGMDQKNGYKAQAMPELEAKIRIAPSTNKSTTRGMSHHFFSCRANSRNSFNSRHMRYGNVCVAARNRQGQSQTGARTLVRFNKRTGGCVGNKTSAILETR